MSRHLENGERLNNVFAMDGLLNKHIRMTAMKPGFPLREYPSNSNYTNDDSVTQQGRRVSCSVDENDDLLIVKDENGSGLLLPYLGTVGTYTEKIKVDGPVSWVCSGKFNGCSSYSVRGKTGNELVFGHLVTPVSGCEKPKDNVDDQANIITDITESDPGTVDKKRVTPPDNISDSANGGYVFWMQTDQQKWVRRNIWTTPLDAIVQIDDSKDIK